MFQKVICLSLLILTVTSCHYSCLYCAGNTQFTHCTQCQKDMSVVYINRIIEDDNSLFKNQIPVGICLSTTTQTINIYGIIILILGAVSYALTNKKYSLEFLNRLQNLAFLSLLQIGFILPGKYLWQGLQYLFIFNTSTYMLKTQGTSLLKENKYNLQKFVKDPAYFSNLALIIITNIAVLLLTLNLFRKFFKCGRKYSTKCQTFLEYVERFAKFLFFFTIAENLIIIETSLKYESGDSTSYLVMGLYFLQLILFLIYIAYFPIKIASKESKSLMYLEIVKKGGYSIMSVLTINPIILPCAMIGVFVVETLFEIIILHKRYWKVYLYKTLEGATIFLFILFTLGDIALNNMTYSQAFSYLMTIAICLYSCIPFVEVFTYYRKKSWAESIKTEIIHQVSNNSSNVPNNIPTQVSLPEQNDNPQRKPLPYIATLISEVNIEDQIQIKEKMSTQNKSKSRAPVKSGSQNSFKSQPNDSKDNKSHTKSHKLLFNQIIKQQPKQAQGKTIELINLNKVGKRGFEDMVIKQQQQSVQNQRSHLPRNHSQFTHKQQYHNSEKDDMTKAGKRRFNRQKRFKGDEEKEKDNEEDDF